MATDTLYDMCNTVNRNQEDNETITSGHTSFSNEQIRHKDAEKVHEQQREQARRETLHDRRKERLKDVAHQSCLYVGSFFVTHLTTFIIRVSSAIMGGSKLRQSMYPLLVIQGIMLPLQGLFNYLIYSRPYYLREALGRDE